MTEFFAASFIPEGGAHRFRLRGDGNIEEIGKIPMNSPSYLALENGRLYAILRTPYAENRDSAAACWDAESGEAIGGMISVRGEGGCHIAVDNGDIYAACYTAGSLIRLPDTQVIHEGHGPNPARQATPHLHSVVLSPDRKYLLSCDLGLDRVFVYTRDMQFVSSAYTPAGAGPRHLCFSACGKFIYVINEMGGSVTVFRWNDGTAEPLHTLSVMPAGAPEEGAGAAIKLSADGRRLYVTERISRTIVTLAADGADLTVLAHTDCRGTEPRDFTLLSGGYAVCTNQFSNSLAMYRLDDNGVPQYLYSYPLAAPLCAVEIT